MTGADLLARIEDWMKGNDASWQEAVLQVVDNEYGLECPWPETPLAVAEEEAADLPPSPETVDLMAALRASLAAAGKP